MIVIKLSVNKIPKERIFVGQKGKYLDLALIENKSGPDQYGNDGFVKIDVSKEARDRGEQGEIVGNWKHVGQKPAQKPAQQRPQRKPVDPDLDAEDEGSVPF
jgi:hypothetical protein